MQILILPLYSNMKTFFSHPIATLLLLLIASLAIADEPNGSISGIITDQETGEPVIGVNVYIPETNIGAATDLSGKFILLNVNPGKHDLSIWMIGYSKVTKKNVRVSPEMETIVNVALQVEILGSSWGDAVPSINIENLPPHLPLFTDSVYMVVDTAMRGKYTVPIYIINTTTKSWKIPTVDWSAWITPVVYKNGALFKYIVDRSSFCGNAIYGSRLPTATYEIFRHPFRSQENPTDSIHYELQISEPKADRSEGERLMLKSANFPGSISDFNLELALWGREHVGSLSQQELRDILHNKTVVAQAYELRANTEAVKRISLYRDLIWLRGINKLKYYYYDSRLSSTKQKKQFLHRVEDEIKLKYLLKIGRRLKLDNFSYTDQTDFNQLMIRLEAEHFKEKSYTQAQASDYRDQMETQGLTSSNEYLRAAAVRYLYDARSAGTATPQLSQLLHSESSGIVRVEILRALGNKHHALAGDSLSVLLEEIASFDDPQLRGAGYYMLARISERKVTPFISTYVFDQLKSETDWNKSLLLDNLYRQDSLDTRTLDLLGELTHNPLPQVRWRLSSLAVKHLHTLYDLGMEDHPQSEDLLDILAVLALDDVLRVQRDALGIYRFGMHDERVMKILLQARADMKSDFPKEMAKKLAQHQGSLQQE